MDTAGARGGGMGGPCAGISLGKEAEHGRAARGAVWLRRRRALHAPTGRHHASMFPRVASSGQPSAPPLGARAACCVRRSGADAGCRAPAAATGQAQRERSTRQSWVEPWKRPTRERPVPGSRAVPAQKRQKKTLSLGVVRPPEKCCEERKRPTRGVHLTVGRMVFRKRYQLIQ
ncbi:hypothetical protein SEVIR_6G204850v4 [Setaria viridis]